MYCTNCGKKQEDNNKFCTSCGNNFQNNINESTPIVTNKSNNETSSIILGILSIVFSAAFIIAIPLGIISIVSGNNAKKEGNKNTGGILGAIGLILSGFFIIMITLVVISIVNYAEIHDDYYKNDNQYHEDNYNNDQYYTNTYSNSNFTVTFDYNWQDASEKNEEMMLKYSDGKSYLMLNDTTALSDSDYKLNSEEERKIMFDEFAEMWKKTGTEREYTFEGDSTKLDILKDDIYYAYYDFKTVNNTYYRLHILASESNNIVISYVTFINRAYQKNSINNSVYNILKTITFTNEIDSNNLNALVF